MMLALNINAGISPGEDCRAMEQRTPSPVVACGSAMPSRPEGKRQGRKNGDAHIILIDGAKK